MGKRKYNIEEYIGVKFGRLKIVDVISKKGSIVKCVCDCSKIHETNIYRLLSGNTKSCGCLYKENLSSISGSLPKHGQYGTRLYNIWSNMKWRCSPKDKDHHYYDNGVKVCKEWEEFASFYEWSINNGYSPSLTIDRIDNNGDYTPFNCRWVNAKVQANNRSTNHFIQVGDEIKTLSQWMEIFGIGKASFYKRLAKGWSEEDAITTPSKKKNYKEYIKVEKKYGRNR